MYLYYNSFRWVLFISLFMTAIYIGLIVNSIRIFSDVIQSTHKEIVIPELRTSLITDASTQIRIVGKDRELGQSSSITEELKVEHMKRQTSSSSKGFTYSNHKGEVISSVTKLTSQIPPIDIGKGTLPNIYVSPIFKHLLKSNTVQYPATNTNDKQLLILTWTKFTSYSWQWFYTYEGLLC